MDIYHPPDLTQPPGDMACMPKITSCTGLCGPVPDTCTGLNVECGPCNASGTVCDLKTNTCVSATTNPCTVGVCGTTKNSCGARFQCPDCSDPAQQCDPNTNSCVACQTIQCSDVGYQCGYAWLGCGDRNTPSNYTYCGDCPTNQICNGLNNLCEPTCSPSPNPLTVCRAANAALGYNCGVISDGCGGTVDCSSAAVTGQDSTFGCKAGYACAAQGDQNICEPFEIGLECVIAGRVCGTINSACGGQPIDCGSCTPPQVCLSNGLCGAPCTPATCPAGYQCGFINDGCGNTMASCGTCPNNNDVCLANHNCCTPETVGQYQGNGQCGNALVDPVCGNTLNVPCPNGGLCSTCNDSNCTTSSTPGVAGTCCNNTAMCPTDGTCPLITNTCTGVQMRCGCAGGKFPIPVATVAPAPTSKPCASYTANKMNGDPCSYNPAFSDGQGNLYTCDCGGNYCITGTPNPGVNPTGNSNIVSGTTIGESCQDVGTCVITSGCNGTITNSCTGAQTACNCGNLGKICGGSNTCVNMDTMCSTFTPPANGTAGAPCTCTNVAPATTCKGNFQSGDRSCTDAYCTVWGGGWECVNVQGLM